MPEQYWEYSIRESGIVWRNTWLAIKTRARSWFSVHIPEIWSLTNQSRKARKSRTQEIKVANDLRRATYEGIRTG